MVLKSQSPAAALTGLVEGVTAKWAKQRRAEERDATARARRDDRLIRWDRPVSLRQAAFQVMQDAYMAASANSTLPANARQIYYAARPKILELAEKESLDSQYFCQTLLIEYMREFDVEWDVVWDDRGHFKEPHTKVAFGLGTLNVRRYLRDNSRPFLEEARFGSAKISTNGPDGRFGAILFVEKEGFMPLFEAVRLAERFDLAIMSSKGMSVTAARMLADRMCARYSIPLLILHDFDVAGFSIGKTIGTDTRRYSFENTIRVIDLGLRLADVEALNLESENVFLGNVSPQKIGDRLRRNDASPEEVDFLLSGRRVELNAMASDQFIAFIESKLTKHGITKVVPAKKTLAEAFRMFERGERIRKSVEDLITAQHAEDIDVPDDLEPRVREYLAENPNAPWEDAVCDAVTKIGGGP
jgi:hypothetical protein